MSTTIHAGDTFLLPDIDDHLWIVISDPANDPDHIIIVCLISWQCYYDQSCVIEAGEHPFAKHRTLVNYSASQSTTAAKLKALLDAKKLKQKQPTSPKLLRRIQTHARGSNMCLEHVEKMQEQCLLE